MEVVAYPTWKCDCEIVYNCGDPNGFPEDGAADSGILKDLAPDSYTIRIPGKRWRRNYASQEEFCEQECEDRLHAFLELESDGTTSTYSHGALCSKMILEGNIASDGSDVPCCEYFLRYGLDWCPDKHVEPLVDLYCFAQDTSGLNTANADADEFVFAAEECDAGTDGDAFDWCAGDLACSALAVEE
ncbi:hypothetical protein HOLleu_30572 [Holothuria leucospilota]|uniref:Uncharacterized protein n=1 Tax=Holothuria leucospilota TaxID=206669 RepID=A0A9Q1GZ21_HOLLE|nr:hypothetical protein HOLleu_30572 [Holothuria leucospilota]